ncbi:asparagine synthetase B [Rhizobacter sp. Root1221]|uniref:asparagine synthetase B family protein n=1 Tax=Rhizobacter sp. Root1221 TaxID=1736433 RepID=UPI0009EB7783|nr:asparagine synthase-related protein [Rhizobacter sp. Root1221]
MSGTVGDFLVLMGESDGAAVAQRLADPKAWAPWPGVSAEVRHEVPAPGVHVWLRGDVRLAASGEVGGLGVAIEPNGTQPAGADVRSATLQAWLRDQQWSADRLRGRFSYVFWDARARRLLACTDAFRSCTLYYAHTPAGLAIASDLRLLVRAGLVAPKVSAKAVYHYLNFSYVPAPFSAIEGALKLPPGHCLESLGGQVSLRKYWDARYPSDIEGTDSQKAEGLRDKMVDTLSHYGSATTEGWGTFLSGGTDSSSIASMLSRNRTVPVNSFSIGFEEEGYDELPYSRIASQAFGLKAHERRVGEKDAVAIIPRLVQAYDEPFGNSSAIPTFYCAELAASHGVNVLVGGDGGDEIFGGNERYRKDQIFERYYRAPGLVRGLGSLAAKSLSGVDSRFANRVKNFVNRGSMPNPDRFYSDDSFASDHFDGLLSEGFRASLQRDDSLDVQRAIFKEADADADLHRLMYLDLKMTIADNDVVKVVRAAKLAGVQVVFPYLDRDLIDYTGRLPASDKVRGLEKRFLFKMATQEILPEEIRKKKKQGFGLPVSVWMRRGGAFHDMVHDVVLSDKAIGRGYCEPGFVKGLIDRHERGAWDHASEIYMLLMLELWHREYIDPHVA